MNLFDNKKLGISISDDSILILESTMINGDIVIGNKNQTKIEEGLVVNGRIIKKEKLKEVLKKYIPKDNITKKNNTEVFLSLREENIFSHSFILELNDLKREKVLEVMETFLPKAVNNYLIEYRVIEGVDIESKDDKERLYVFALAVEKDLLNECQSFFSKLGLKIKSFKPESVAQKNTINDSREVLLLNTGKGSCTFSTFINDQLFYSYRYEYDNIFEGELEGLDIDSVSEKTDLLKKILSEIAREIEESATYLKKNTDKNLKALYLRGKIFEVKGAKKYLQKELVGMDDEIELIEAKKDGKVDINFLTPYGLVKDSINKKEIYFSLDTGSSFSLIQIVDSIKNYQKIFLLFLAFLVMGSLLSFYFNKENISPAIVDESPVEYQEESIFSYDIFLVDGKAVRENEIGGRFFEIVFSEPMSDEDIIESAKTQLEEESGENEFYWQVPQEDFLNKENLVFPLRTNWFIGEEKDLEIILEEKVYSKIEKDIDYDLDMVLNNPIDESLQKDLYKTNLKIVFYHNSGFSIYEPEEVLEKKILIVNTRGNNINIRKGPGTNYPVVAQAREGEDYLFLGEEGSWVNIEISDGSSSWISSLFVKKIN